ncbi:unnamed protein product [Didymodactylos carnosus]|uniref:HTH psq-type domain-containing protein n=1 Tax=Didymodactylos carnosus TaxID=1234261 RepID=A0A816D0T7_9BILA|nr:unnamed protein product [Didymodactylos carnosus]CAF1632090.1 unnamed protein product [Didymodactylos carnosus]CAF4394572.1 unnamed protein product [Didymodactylos carnosus]CAF4532129.1 unnamed protein product [Didymodactylos carnosus]
MPRTYVKEGQGPRYSNEDFQNALVEITRSNNIRAAARKYNIPYTTLQIHYFAQGNHRGAGQPTHFTDLEEMFLVGAVTVLQEWGEPITTKQRIQMATYYAQELGKDKIFKIGKPTVEIITH